jgi:hypothetical protein
MKYLETDFLKFRFDTSLYLNDIFTGFGSPGSPGFPGPSGQTGLPGSPGGCNYISYISSFLRVGGHSSATTVC